MGKWSFLKGTYPNIPVDAEYQQKLDAVLDAPAFPTDPRGPTVRQLGSDQLAALYNQARKVKEDLEAKLAVVNLQIEAFTRLFIDRFEEEGVTSTKFGDGTTISISDEPYAQIKDQRALLGWVKENGLESMLTLNYQTMSSMVKELIQSGKPLPPGVDVYMKSKLSRRGGKEKTTNE